MQKPIIFPVRQILSKTVLNCVFPSGRHIYISLGPFHWHTVFVALEGKICII